MYNNNPSKIMFNSCFSFSSSYFSIPVTHQAYLHNSAQVKAIIIKEMQVFSIYVYFINSISTVTFELNMPQNFSEVIVMYKCNFRQ